MQSVTLSSSEVCFEGGPQSFIKYCEKRIQQSPSQCSA